MTYMWTDLAAVQAVADNSRPAFGRRRAARASRRLPAVPETRAALTGVPRPRPTEAGTA